MRLLQIGAKDLAVMSKSWINQKKCADWLHKNVLGGMLFPQNPNMVKGSELTCNNNKESNKKLARDSLTLIIKSKFNIGCKLDLLKPLWCPIILLWTLNKTPFEENSVHQNNLEHPLLRPSHLKPPYSVPLNCWIIKISVWLHER